MFNYYAKHTDTNIHVILLLNPDQVLFHYASSKLLVLSYL